MKLASSIRHHHHCWNTYTPTRLEAQHFGCFFNSGRCLKDSAAEDNGSIRSQNDAAGVGLADGFGFGDGDAFDVGERGFVLQGRFVDIRRLDGEGHTEFFQQEFAVGGLAGEDEVHGIWING